jgi:hypothetical protein
MGPRASREIEAEMCVFPRRAPVGRNTYLPIATTLFGARAGNRLIVTNSTLPAVR